MAAAGPTQVINANIRLNVICMSCAYGWYLFGGKAKTNAQLSIQEIIPTVAGRLSSRIDFIGLTTQAQRPGARDAAIANHDAMPGSLQRMVRRLA